MPQPTTAPMPIDHPGGGNTPPEDDHRVELLGHVAAMWRLTRCYFRQHADREDALQDALLAAVRGLAGFERRCRLGTWLHRLTVNACLMKLRGDGRRALRDRAALTIDDETPAGGPSPIDALLQRERAVAVAGALDALSDDFRTVLALRLAGRDVAGCAAILGVSTDVVKVRCHRARAAVRKQLHRLTG